MLRFLNISHLISSANFSPKNYTPANFLLIMTFCMALVFSTWQVLLNNFVIEQAAFTGKEIGILQSLREVPGFLAFTAIYVLLFIKEQLFATLALLLTCIGVGLTGFYPSAMGLYVMTVIMSIGFHYYETVNQSLTLQWLPKEQTASFMGRALSVKAIGALSAYAVIWTLMEYLQWPYVHSYALIGGLGALIVILLWMSFPQFNASTVQTKKLFVKKQYSLYYALVFFSGARRQIFMVFAAFLMVEKFGYSVGEISALFMINYVFNLIFAPKIGNWIGKVGERKALVFEYVGLIVVFISYAWVDNAYVAGGLYVIDHMFFALAIAMKTYFQKIADPRDIAATASVSFTINHIAAVVIPALLGILWLSSPSIVFYIGAGFAMCSLVLAWLLPLRPEQGNETRFGAII
jgi:hypothetical protein